MSSTCSGCITRLPRRPGARLQAYSAQNTCPWIPQAAGAYLISVTARDGTTGEEVNRTCWYTVTPAGSLSAVAIAASPASPQPATTTITVTATATGGNNIQYLFWLYNPAFTPAWSLLQAYSAQDICPWIPQAAGAYLISVTAKDGTTGEEVNQTCWYTVTPAGSLSAVAVAASPASPQPAATTITVTATATGGNNVQYLFWLYNPAFTPAWSLLQAYSAQNTCPWMPQVAGAYLISVTAKDGTTGMEVNQTTWYTVQ